MNPLTTVKAHILARTLLATTRQAIELESYPNHPRIQQVFGSKSKKNAFRFQCEVRWGDRCKWGCFDFFWPPLPGPGPQPIGPLFWLKIVLETRPKSASLEPLNDFLAYEVERPGGSTCKGSNHHDRTGSINSQSKATPCRLD